MYKIGDIRTIHLEITNKCQASCPMCARNIQGSITNPLISLTEISLETFQNWFPKTFIAQLDRIFMCGNLGDPIIATDTLEIFSYIKECNPNIKLGMNTNGSARNTSWWKSLAKLGIVIRFGIDGLEDTHSIYRIGTDFNKIIANASAFISADGYAIWDMLIFDHNKHQIESCRKLANDLKFKEFVAKNTSRFRDDKLNVLDKNGKTQYVIYPSDRSKEISSKSSCIPTKILINCKSKNEQSLYISANGNVLPCCWLDMEWWNLGNSHRIDYMDNIGRYLNLQNYSLEEIFDIGLFDKIEKMWSNVPLKECSKRCGNFDHFNEQFK